LFWWWSWRKQVAEEFPGRSARWLRFGSSGKQGGANNEKECSGYAQYPRQMPAQGADAKRAIARHHCAVLAAIKAGAHPSFFVPDQRFRLTPAHAGQVIDMLTALHAKSCPVRANHVVPGRPARRRNADVVQ
jgi:hypothetical protein